MIIINSVKIIYIPRLSRNFVMKLKKYEKQMQIILRELVPHKASIPTRAFCTLSVLPQIVYGS